jgi:hypothetical protein
MSTRLLSTAGTLGEIQIVSAPSWVVLDIAARNYDSAGHLHRDFALLKLTLDCAQRLHQLLGDAIEASLDASAAAQPTLWSENALRAMADQPRHGRVV